MRKLIHLVRRNTPGAPATTLTSVISIEDYVSRSIPLDGGRIESLDYASPRGMFDFQRSKPNARVTI
jgi:hypothetical protein